MGKRWLIIGAARSGLAAAKFLAEHNEMVLLTDIKEPAPTETLETLKSLGVVFLWGQQPNVEKLQPDQILMSPGVPLTIPPVVYAKEHQIPVLGELELAYLHCKAPFVAITGTNGKTTTTTLTGELLKKTGRNIFVGGNIGVPLIQQVEQLTSEDIVVAEVSSFQLESTETFCPHLALMLNLTPDHLDRHGNMQGYLAAKAKIFANQQESDYLILNYDDEILREQAKNSRGKVIFFSQKHKLEEGVFLDGENVILSYQGKTSVVCRADEILIKGKHNLENAMGALLLAFFSGVSLEMIREVLMKFPGVEHRLEPVRTVDEVLYVNDSKGTNPDSTIKALEAYNRPVILILGGKNKGSDFTQLVQIIKKKVKQVVVLGQAKPVIVEALNVGGFQNYKEVDTFEEAVLTASSLAKAGDLVLLSPACASWDMFSSYEERGQLFKKIVASL